MEHRVTHNSAILQRTLEYLAFSLFQYSFRDYIKKHQQFEKQNSQNVNFCSTSCFIFETNCVFFVQTKLPSLDSMKMDLDDDGHLVGTARC